MWIKSINATVEIQDQIAVTHIDQIFNNELNSSVEAIYIFPLPEDAVLTEMVYWVNGQRFVSSIRERQEAVSDYNDKLRQWLDPALLEYLGDNLFRLSIVPIDANSDVRTEITYVEPLKYDLGQTKYNFGLNTLELSSKPLQLVSVSVDAKSQNSFKNFYSPTHQSSTATKIEKMADNHYTLFFGDENFYPDKDLTLEFETIRDSVDFNVLTYTPTTEDSIGTESYYSIRVIPPDSISGEELIPRHIVFTADVSSSMEGLRIKQVKEALDNFLILLNPNDKFNIVTFGTFVTKFQNDLVDANENNIASARTFVNQLYPLGLTNIDDALTASLDQAYEDSVSNILVFLTDGEPTWGNTDKDSILAHVNDNNKKSVRIFSFGVGSEINKSLLADLANSNHGYANFIASDDSIALVINEHFQRISKPVMTDVQLSINGLNNWDTYPKTLGDLYWGSQIVQLGLYNTGGSYNVTLSGKLRSKTVEYNKIISFPDTSGGQKFVPRLWAKEKIDHLLNLIAIYGESDELVDQIVELSLRYQVLTPYTAFYTDPSTNAVDNEEQIPGKFYLAQNYPNPFNPTTTIEYNLPEGLSSYHVVIKIYNSLGQLVTILADKEQSAGKYRITWNGTDIKGSPVASGIYFYSLDAGDFRQIRKMILLR